MAFNVPFIFRLYNAKNSRTNTFSINYAEGRTFQFCPYDSTGPTGDVGVLAFRKGSQVHLLMFQDMVTSSAGYKVHSRSQNSKGTWGSWSSSTGTFMDEQLSGFRFYVLL